VLVGGKRIKMVIEKPQLFNMMQNLGEQYNVIDSYPEKVEDNKKTSVTQQMIFLIFCI